MCDNCPNRYGCSFYEKGARECVYDAMARFADIVSEREKEKKKEKKKDEGARA